MLAIASAHPAAAAVFRTGQPAMGTVLQVTVVAADDAAARAAAEAAISEVRHWDDVLTTWRADGELARLNARAGAGPVPVSPDLASALSTMQRLSAATSAAFDPAVGRLVDLWRGPTPPSSAALAAAARVPLAAALVLDGERATLREGIKLDAGGIAKGMALDAAAVRLRASGAQAAYLDFGGSSQLAIGAPPGSPEGWQIAVSGAAADRILGVIMLRGAALSTSRVLGGPSPAGVIIDPRTGQPLPGPRLATVRATDATTAEAWSKAVLIDGRTGLDRAAAAGLDGLLDTPSGTERTPGFIVQPMP
jgi:thiamine biosynthesis lipoprotein